MVSKTKVVVITLIFAVTLTSGRVNDQNNFASDTNVCSLEPVRGTCRALYRRYFYNPVVNECREFFYGGCGGNGNNFDSKSSCESACRQKSAGRQNAKEQNPIDCRLPIDGGPCRGYFPKWAFNGVYCQEFIYGGCGGNWNRFETSADCETNCAVVAEAIENGQQSKIDSDDNQDFPMPPPFDSTPTGGSLAPMCTWPLTAGPCRGYFPRWGYQGDRCVEFVYGGCGGNANRFETRLQCEERCLQSLAVTNENGQSGQRQGRAPFCNQPMLTGPCRGYFPRWGFDGTRCVKFVYGGCQGNGNNFDTEQQCQASCMSVSSGASAITECPMVQTRQPPPGCEIQSVTMPNGCPSSEIRCTEGICSANPCTGRCEYCVNDPQLCPPGALCLGYRCAAKEGCNPFAANDKRSAKFLDSSAKVSNCANVLCPSGHSCQDSTSAAATCVPIPKSPSAETKSFASKCKMPVDAGNCDGALNRWFFSVVSKSCERFTFGGCGGNENNFESRESCQLVCGDNSDNEEPKFGDDSDVYRECSKIDCNQNEKCEIVNGIAECVGLASAKNNEDNVCSLPLSKGSCSDQFQRFYYYNSRTGRCEAFAYGGCGGNRNRFKNYDECRRRCLSLF